MKNLHKLILCVMLLAGFTSCQKDEPTAASPYLDVTYANVAGIWKLKSWSGGTHPESTYFYVVLDRKKHTFEIFQNLDSDQAKYRTGTYELVAEKNKNIIKGMYDYALGFWSNDYYITRLSGGEMTWTVTEGEDMSVYTRVSSIPEEILSAREEKVN